MRSLESIKEANEQPAHEPRERSYKTMRLRAELNEISRHEILHGLRRRDAVRWANVYVREDNKPKSWRDLPKAQRDARMDAFERDLRN